MLQPVAASMVLPVAEMPATAIISPCAAAYLYSWRCANIVLYEPSHPPLPLPPTNTVLACNCDTSAAGTNLHVLSDRQGSPTYLHHKQQNQA